MASPMRSPFKSIANCVIKVFKWDNDGSPSRAKIVDANKESPIKKSENKSRSTSPEIPKLQEPAKFTLKINENMEATPEKAIRRSSRVPSAPTTPRTPRSRVKAALDFTGDNNDKKDSAKKSTRQRSTPATPSTPKNTPKCKRVLQAEEASPKASPRRSSRVSTPRRNYIEKHIESPPTADEDMDFEYTSVSERPRRKTGTPAKSVRALAFSEKTKEQIEKNSYSPRSKKTSEAAAPRTPKRRQTCAVAIAHKDTPAKRRRTMTPRIAARSVPLGKNMSLLEEAQMRLHVGAVPDSLPCRDDEYTQIYCFTENNIRCGTGGCMYISGVPGMFMKFQDPNINF